jgi:putative photosynthetic complex assembly protein
MTTRSQLATRDRDMIPKPLLFGMLGLALSSLALVGYARITDRPLEGVPEMRPVVAERLLSFAHAEDRRIAVTEAGVEIALMTGRSAGFIDAYTAALERRRLVSRADPDAPIRVAAFEDGHVVLIDPETGWRVDPRSFGAEAQAVFAAYLEGS